MTSAKRIALSAVVLAGLVLAGVGGWLLGHLGVSGSATFTARPAADRVVVLGPAVLNRVDSPVTVRASARGGTDVWIGTAAPSDLRALLGGAASTTVSGASLPGWRLDAQHAGRGPAPALAQADIWHASTAGKGRAALTVDQRTAPQAVVIATPAGAPADLTSVSVTWQRQGWGLGAVTLLVLGLVVAAGAVVGLRLPRAGAGLPLDPRRRAGAHRPLDRREEPA